MDREKRIELIKTAISKQYIGLPPETYTMEGDFGDLSLRCPSCKKPIVNVWSTAQYNPRYCHYCGQKLLWKKGEE